MPRLKLRCDDLRAFWDIDLPPGTPFDMVDRLVRRSLALGPERQYYITYRDHTGWLYTIGKTEWEVFLEAYGGKFQPVVDVLLTPEEVVLAQPVTRELVAMDPRGVDDPSEMKSGVDAIVRAAIVTSGAEYVVATSWKRLDPSDIEQGHPNCPTLDPTMRATPSSLESLASHHSPTAQRNSSSSSLKVDNVSDSTITDDEDHGWEREMCEEQMKREIVSRLRVIRERARVERLRRGGNQGRFGDEDRRNEGESKDYTGQSDAAIRKSRIVPRLSSTSNNLSMLLTAARQLEATAPFRLDHTIHTTTAGTIGDLKQIMPSAMPSRKSAHSAWWAPNCEWSRRHPQWGGWKVRFTDPITPTQLRHRIPPSNVVTAFPPELPPLHPGPPGDSHPTPLPSLHSVVEYQRPTQLGHSDGGTRAYGANRSNGIRKLRGRDDRRTVVCALEGDARGGRVRKEGRSSVTGKNSPAQADREVDLADLLEKYKDDVILHVDDEGGGGVRYCSLKNNSSVNDLVRHLQVVFNDFTIQATMLLCEDDGEWDYLLERDAKDGKILFPNGIVRLRILPRR